MLLIFTVITPRRNALLEAAAYADWLGPYFEHQAAIATAMMSPVSCTQSRNAAEQWAGAHFAELGSSAAGDLRDAKSSKLSFELLQLLLQVTLGLVAQLVNLELHGS